MSIRDGVGVVLCATGIALVSLGLHWLGSIWLWIGIAVLFFGLVFLLNERRNKKLERALRDYRGPGDYGDTHYHSGQSASDTFTSTHDAGGDASGH